MAWRNLYQWEPGLEPEWVIEKRRERSAQVARLRKQMRAREVALVRRVAEDMGWPIGATLARDELVRLQERLQGEPIPASPTWLARRQCAQDRRLERRAEREQRARDKAAKGVRGVSAGPVVPPLSTPRGYEITLMALRNRLLAAGYHVETLRAEGWPLTWPQWVESLVEEWLDMRPLIPGSHVLVSDIVSACRRWALTRVAGDRDIGHYVTSRSMGMVLRLRGHTITRTNSGIAVQGLILKP